MTLSLMIHCKLYCYHNASSQVLRLQSDTEKLHAIRKSSFHQIISDGVIIGIGILLPTLSD